MIAKQDRTVRIEVGYGLEGVLPDAMAKRIVEEIIVPNSGGEILPAAFMRVSSK